MKLRTLLAALTGAALAAGAASAATPLAVHIAVRDHGFGFRNIGIRAARVKLEVANRGHRRHDVVIRRAGSAKSRVIVASRVLAPGQSATLRLRLKPGHYRLYSKLDHDRAHGLSAPLVVMAPSIKGGAEMSRVFYNFY